MAVRTGFGFFLLCGILGLADPAFSATKKKSVKNIGKTKTQVTRQAKPVTGKILAIDPTGKSLGVIDATVFNSTTISSTMPDYLPVLGLAKNKYRINIAGRRTFISFSAIDLKSKRLTFNFSTRKPASISQVEKSIANQILSLSREVETELQRSVVEGRLGVCKPVRPSLGSFSVASYSSVQCQRPSQIKLSQHDELGWALESGTVQLMDSDFQIGNVAETLGARYFDQSRQRLNPRKQYALVCNRAADPSLYQAVSYCTRKVPGSPNLFETVMVVTAGDHKTNQVRYQITKTQGIGAEGTKRILASHAQRLGVQP